MWLSVAYVILLIVGMSIVSDTLQSLLPPLPQFIVLDIHRMTADDAFFLDFLPGSRSIPELSRQLVDQLIALPDRAITTLHQLLDKLDGYIGRQQGTSPPPFLAPPQDPTTLERLQSWISRNKVLVAVIVLGTGAIVTGVIVKRNAREMGRKRRAKRFANGQRKEAVGIVLRGYYMANSSYYGSHTGSIDSKCCS